MAALESDFSAGYYYVCTLLIVLIVTSIIYQFFQLSTYIDRTKEKRKPDLPQQMGLHKNGSSNTTIDNVDSNNNLISPLAKGNVHITPVVWAHKGWNYVVHVLGIGDITIGHIILLLTFLVLNLLFLFLPFPSDVGMHMLSIRFAFMGISNAAFIFPLATRNSIFTRLIGIPFERMITFHRWVGRTILILLTFHASYQIQSNFKSSNSVTYSIWGTNIYKYGFLAYLFLFITVAAAHSVFRRFAFEAFYWTHFNFIFFIIFGCLHQKMFFYFTITGVSLYCLDKIVRIIYGWRKVHVVSMEALPSGLTRVAFEFNRYYESGQYIFVNFPTLKLPISLIDWHPFSLSSSPMSSIGKSGDDAEVEGESVATVHPKIQGGFTHTLYGKAQEGSQMREAHLTMRIDGPYGNLSVDFSAYRAVILISGGVGITPMISVLGDLVDTQIKSERIVTQSIHFYWIIPDTGKLYLLLIASLIIYSLLVILIN